ncbi:hypothetical protein GGS20DRAFT_540362 [Poronia punctata]|nr:hypothetical protein GGS20DRAFT_540362 [Poronia punctata]
MSGKPTTTFQKIWLQWKSLRLPWRKRFLAGTDLQGNTYWEFNQARGDGPQPVMRRIVHYPRSTPYSEVKVPPAWHQWLRYQRPAPPSIQEQTAEAMRQERIKVLAAEADARWEAKASLLDKPEPTPKQPAMIQGDAAQEEQQQQQADVKKDRQAKTKTKTKDDPWKKADRSGPGESWQPEAWNPTPSKRR